MINYTKGEWEQGGQVIYKADGRPIIATVNYIGMEDEGKANAQLIAAAPDMYEVLKDIAEMKVMPVSYIELAKRALAKVEKEELSCREHWVKTVLGEEI